ncbi:hypothetical protein AVEN_190882-1 [Araneus ventricosus]|uniref:Uncharacterized protein n=1 Tax=Araneus ventricosus TaxID=182803 RepID=A0A4Y2CTS2_ARAVE|nr:hypothetical protein AVEN_190882-1 [Araneus ventricosus]
MNLDLGLRWPVGSDSALCFKDRARARDPIALKIHTVHMLHAKSASTVFNTLRVAFSLLSNRMAPHLSDSDYCSCGGIGRALHYATECIYTVSWHMRKPAPNFEQEWLKRIANNLVCRQKIREIIKFTLAKTEIFSDLPSLQHPSELNQVAQSPDIPPSNKRKVSIKFWTKSVYGKSACLSVRCHANTITQKLE